jgi:hypothetical protein
LSLSVRISFGMIAFLYMLTLQAGTRMEPFSKMPIEQRDALTKRLNAYVDAYRHKMWGDLYKLVSTIGRGGVTQDVFVNAMTSEHRADFAQMPDLLEFRPELTEKNDKGEFDIYGCAKATREGMTFNGIAVTHAVFENNEWFFTGWSFTEFPNEPCKALSDPKWQPENRMTWSKPMEEVENLKLKGAPVHVDTPH